MKNKRLVIIFIVVIFLLVASLYFFYFKKNNKENINNKFSVKFLTTDKVELKNILPVSDRLGKMMKLNSARDGTFGYIEFIIANKNNKPIQYDIYLTEQNLDEQKIESEYIKLYLSDINGKPYKGFDSNIIPSFHDLYALSDIPSARLLYSSNIDANSKEKFYLRSWLADNYGNIDESQYFQFDVNVKVK